MKNIVIPILLICVPQLSFAVSLETVETEHYAINYQSPPGPINLILRTTDCASVISWSINYTHNQQDFEIHIDSLPAPVELPLFCPSGSIFSIPMGRLSPGIHKILLIDSNGTESFDIVIEDVYPTHFNAEMPAAGSIQSGIGLIRGWACDATSISIQIDPHLPLDSLQRLPIENIPYGGPRNDTQTICGDSDNGYAIAINWNEFSKGIHRIRTNFIGTGMSSEVEFEVQGH